MKASPEGQIKTRPNSRASNGGAKPARRPRTAGERARTRANHPPLMTDVLTPEADLSAAVTIMALDQTYTRTCRWPVQGAGADMLYCGCRPVIGTPYCGPHARRAYAS